MNTGCNYSDRYPPPTIDTPQYQLEQEAPPECAITAQSGMAIATFELSALFTNCTPIFGATEIIGASHYVDGHSYQGRNTADSSTRDFITPMDAFPVHAYFGHQYPHGMSEMTHGYVNPGTGNLTWGHDWSLCGAMPSQLPSCPFAHPLMPTDVAGVAVISTEHPLQVAQRSGRNQNLTGDGSPGHPYPSFDPITASHASIKKRTRRRAHEIDRSYKCGWNGCEKGYGFLNHLNAHVLTKGHGKRRTPAEFMYLREERRAKKKEEAKKIKEEQDQMKEEEPDM